MAKISDAAPESAEMSIREIKELQAETARNIERFSKEAERNSKEIDKKFADIGLNFERISKEAERISKEAERRNKEAERRNKEAEKRNAALSLNIERISKEIDEKFKEIGEKQAETARVVKKVGEIVGSIGNNNGSFAEEYFFNAFENGRHNFFGEKFDSIKNNVKGFYETVEDEYDILLINGKSVGIVEVKYRANETDIPNVLKKAKTFRITFPYYAKHKVYLGLASMSFYPDLEEECIREGIAVIKQVGDKVVIYDEHIKVF